VGRLAAMAVFTVAMKVVPTPRTCEGATLSTSQPLLVAVAVNVDVAVLVTVTFDCRLPEGYPKERALGVAVRDPVEPPPPLPVPTVKFTGIESAAPPLEGVTVIVARYVVLLARPAEFAVTVSRVDRLELMVVGCPGANATLSQAGLSVVGLERVTPIVLVVVIEIVPVAVLGKKVLRFRGEGVADRVVDPPPPVALLTTGTVARVFGGTALSVKVKEVLHPALFRPHPLATVTVRITGEAAAAPDPGETVNHAPAGNVTLKFVSVVTVNCTCVVVTEKLTLEGLTVVAAEAAPANSSAPAKKRAVFLES